LEIAAVTRILGPFGISGEDFFGDQPVCLFEVGDDDFSSSWPAWRDPVRPGRTSSAEGRGHNLPGQTSEK
jgi:hypothetical protein